MVAALVGIGLQLMVVGFLIWLMKDSGDAKIYPNDNEQSHFTPTLTYRQERHAVKLLVLILTVGFILAQIVGIFVVML